MFGLKGRLPPPTPSVQDASVSRSGVLSSYEPTSLPSLEEVKFKKWKPALGKAE